MLPVTDIPPSMALSLRRPALKALKEEVGFLAPRRTRKAFKVAKIGICPAALADEIMDSHAFSNNIHTDLMKAAVTIAGKAALLHWLKFASL